MSPVQTIHLTYRPLSSKTIGSHWREMHTNRTVKSRAGKQTIEIRNNRQTSELEMFNRFEVNCDRNNK